jgi:hypothetical protein
VRHNDRTFFPSGTTPLHRGRRDTRTPPLQTHRTADSDKYDEESNDRLVQADVAYCEAHAKKCAPPAAVPQGDGWQLVPGQAVNYTAKATGDSTNGQRPFSLQIE